jgi:hypothetical protein
MLMAEGRLMAKAANQPEDLFDIPAADMPSADEIVAKAMSFDFDYT